MLGMLLAGGLMTLLYLLSTDDTWREAARKMLLSEKEERVLSETAARALEPPRLKPPSENDLERLTADIADQIGRGQIGELIEDLERKQAAIDDVRANLEREEAEIRLARSDLRRIQIQIEEAKRELAEQHTEERTERERFAEVKRKVAAGD